MNSDRRNVLIVDDEPAICSLIRDGLEERDVRSVTCTEPRRAKQLLESRGFRVLVADIAMPDVTGLDLLAYVRECLPDCKVILITGVRNTDTLARALRLGAFDYLLKPFDIEQLADAVGRAEDPAEGGKLCTRAAEAMAAGQQAGQVALESIRALARAVEAKDPYTRRHSDHVTHYAVHLAQYTEILSGRLKQVRTAALLHDIGKIGIPDTILTKPGGLTEAEFEQIRRHPRLGAEILEQISCFREEARLIRTHHENWDGSGYPDGLAGEDIPLGGRLLNIADSMDAMMMARTYKEAYPVERMVSELQRCSGTQFAPDLAAAAVEWCRENPDKLIGPEDEPAVPPAS